MPLKPRPLEMRGMRPPEPPRVPIPDDVGLPPIGVVCPPVALGAMPGLGGTPHWAFNGVVVLTVTAAATRWNGVERPRVESW